MVDIEVDDFRPVKGEIVGIDAFLSLLAEALLEVGAHDVGRVFLLGLFSLLKPIDVVVEGVEESLFFLFFLL